MSKEFPYIRAETEPLRGYESERRPRIIIGNNKNLIREIRGGLSNNLTELELKATKIRELFKTFEENSGIKVVKTEYIIKSSSLYPPYYQIDAFSERIDGKNLEDILEFTDIQAQQVQELLKKLFEYFKKSYTNKSVILSDIFRPEQYVLGKRSGNAEEAIYLVDIDPITEDNYERDGLNYDVLDMLDELLLFCDYMEKKNKSLNLQSLKEQIREVIKKIEVQ